MIFVPRSRGGTLALWEPATVACYSVALLLVSSRVFVSSAFIQCSVKLNAKLNSLGRRILLRLVRVVALWEPATVACFSVALLLVSSSVFISSAVIQCSIQPRGPDAGRGPGGWTLWERRILLREQ
jgi:hypothetical protein